MRSTPPTSNPLRSCLTMVALWVGALVLVVLALTVFALLFG